jgi:glycosyl transferase family 25
MWKFFDAIYCINLYSRDDRMIRCKKMFEMLKIPASFYRVHKHPTDGARGCYESHLSVIRNAYYRGCKNILIFEDDVIESPLFDVKLIEKAIEFMQNNENWDIFYLGHQPDIFINLVKQFQKI